MSRLAICGKARLYTEEELASYYNVWTTGTSPIIGADRYYEFHPNIVTNHKNVYTLGDIEPSLVDHGFPLANSICIMLAQAWYEGWTDINILGSPLISGQEYIRERPALAYMVGYVKARGMSVYWEGGVKSHVYMLGGK